MTPEDARVTQAPRLSRALARRHASADIRLSPTLKTTRGEILFTSPGLRHRRPPGAPLKPIRRRLRHAATPVDALPGAPLMPAPRWFHGPHADRRALAFRLLHARQQPRLSGLDGTPAFPAARQAMPGEPPAIYFGRRAAPPLFFAMKLAAFREVKSDSGRFADELSPSSRYCQPGRRSARIRPEHRPRSAAQVTCHRVDSR